MSLSRAAFYLQIPARYCRSFGGLRWAQYGEAIEFLDGPAAGHTFAFAAEIDAFVEGLADSDRALPAFGFVLHLLYLVGLGDRAARHGEGVTPCIERIAAPFRALGCPLRNAGALCGFLSHGAPSAADSPGLAELHEIMSGGSWVPQMVLSHPLLGAMDQAEEPGIDSEAFQEMIHQAAERQSDSEIRHWLRHGCATADSQREGPIPFHPRNLGESLAEFERRPRLAGIGRLITRLEGLISLPPRRLTWSDWQDGGYADVTTRGAPEQILPIQFALESHEFLRRFAEKELLYFHREEPRQSTTEEIVLLLDQGARTWGDVRLALTGSAIALARRAQDRKIPIKLATTANDGEAVDPARLEPQKLSELLESSDLSPNPGQALARLLAVSARIRRDLVLLTHPRSAADPGVLDVARNWDGDDLTRLFAITVDTRGQLEVLEIKRGRPVVLGRSRISLADPDPPRKPVVTAADHARAFRWDGPVETVGFPFRTGALGDLDPSGKSVIASFDFDESGERVLFATRHGILYSCKVNGREAETVPRPLLDGAVVKCSKTVLGVAGGFVVEGESADSRLLAHYDFKARSVKVHEIGASGYAYTWMYYRELHTITGVPSRADLPRISLDLAEDPLRASASARAHRAAELLDSGVWPEDSVFFRSSRTTPGQPPGTGSRPLVLDPRTGTLVYRPGPAVEQSFTPLLEGKPALRGGWIESAKQAGSVLAINVAEASSPGLYFLALPQFRVLGTVPLLVRHFQSAFAISRDGRRFARETPQGHLEVRDVPGDQPPLWVSSHERAWIHFATLGNGCLLVREFLAHGPRHARSTCLFRWDQGYLDVVFDDAYLLLGRLGGTVAVSRSLPPGSPACDHDHERFVQVVEGHGLRIMIDRYNHLVVMAKDGPVVCIFFVNGNEVAAWLPDGIMWGSRRLIGGEPAKGAAERIAAALAAVEAVEGIS
jgi:hypothetical protein